MNGWASVLCACNDTSCRLTREESAARQAEQAVADDRALHLARAAGDRRRLRPQPLPLPRTRERRARALQLQRRLRQMLRHVGPRQLHETGLRAGFDAASETRERAPV